MTYKFDSDVMWFTIKFSDINSGTLIAPAKDLRWKGGDRFSVSPDIVKVSKKHKDIVWFVDDCKLLQLHKPFLEEMKKHFKIDTYGKCGDNR